eukprot:TRINITY_DN7742_c0_g2_i2.p1 TRINITY_DN7742_c0_g2~~TRINITY_DN7742_c0_g2_i2.p1  ORF type:complete len:167 (+),score=35.99 TRINITY_DN7742_c0_g2_i2:319-819(+)
MREDVGQPWRNNEREVSYGLRMVKSLTLTDDTGKLRIPFEGDSPPLPPAITCNERQIAGEAIDFYNNRYRLKGNKRLNEIHRTEWTVPQGLDVTCFGTIQRDLESYWSLADHPSDPTKPFKLIGGTPEGILEDCKLRGEPHLRKSKIFASLGFGLLALGILGIGCK